MKMNNKEYILASSDRMANPSHWREKQLGRISQSETQPSKGLEPERMKALTKMSLSYLVKISREGAAGGEWRTLSAHRLQDPKGQNGRILEAAKRKFNRRDQWAKNSKPDKFWETQDSKPKRREKPK